MELTPGTSGAGRFLKQYNSLPMKVSVNSGAKYILIQESE